MLQSEVVMRTLFNELRAGDFVEVTHHITVGSQTWTAVVRGIVMIAERRRHGLHYQRNQDDKVWSDVLVLKRDDGEATTITLDEYTRLKRIDPDKAVSTEGHLLPNAER